MAGSFFTAPLNALGLAHRVLEDFVCPGDLCIDATAGRGRDTALLARLVGPEGRVIAMDIQAPALEASSALLAREGLTDRVRLVLDSHANMARYAQPQSVKAVVFNLGWLPGGDHSIFSRAESTLPAVEQALELLVPGGLISLCMYCGKECGYEEKQRLLAYLATVDDRRFTVVTTDFYNRTGDFPVPAFVIKRT